MKKLLPLAVFILFSSNLFAQNFSGGFNFTPPYDDGTNMPFLPKFPAKPINIADKVSVNNGNFIVKGKPYRFWGINITAASNFASNVLAEKVSNHARKMGINLVRFHHLDNPWAGSAGSLMQSNQSTRFLNPINLAKLDYFIFQLKQNGIYTNMNLNVSRTFNTLDGIAGADSLKEYSKGVTIFDPQLITLQKEYATQILAHVNPNTGLKLAEDPCLAVVEMINENSLYGMWKDNQLKNINLGGNLLYRHVRRLDSLWNAFLIKKYTNQINLSNAWASSGTPIVERIQDGGFEGASLNANWQNELHNGSVATFTLDNTEKKTGTKSAKGNTTTAGGTDWNIQFKHVNFSLNSGQTYLVKFSAKASKNRSIAVALSRNDAPYTWYAGQNFNLTTTWQDFVFPIAMIENLVGNGRLSFNLGTSDGQVWIDDVSLAEPTIVTLESGENLTNKNIRRLDYSERGLFAKQRVADLAEFYIKLQKDFMEEMRNFLKNTLNVTAAITGTNALTGFQEGMEHENMDYYDDHAYWDHPEFPGASFDVSNWKIKNNSMLKSTGFMAITSGISGIHLNNKPYTISEYNHAFPNRYRSEMVHSLAAYSAFHGVDGIMYFEYNSDPDASWNTDKVSNFFSINRDNSIMGLFPAFAYAYRKGLIAEATPTIVNYSESDIYNSFEKDNYGRWGKYVPYDLNLQLTQSIRTGNYHSATNFNLSSLPAVSSNIFTTSTNETILNKITGILTTNTPKFQALTGALNDGANTVAGDLKLISSNDFGSVSWISLDNKPLNQSDTTLISISSKLQNTGMVWNGTNTSMGTNFGSAPTQMIPLNTVIRINSTTESIRVHTLSNTGASISSKIVAPISAGVYEITLNQATDQTMWYGLEGIKKKINSIICMPLDAKRLR
jgi:Carbohydrate binding domain